MFVFIYFYLCEGSRRHDEKAWSLFSAGSYAENLLIDSTGFHPPHRTRINTYKRIFLLLLPHSTCLFRAFVCSHLNKSLFNDMLEESSFKHHSTCIRKIRENKFWKIICRGFWRKNKIDALCHLGNLHWRENFRRRKLIGIPFWAFLFCCGRKNKLFRKRGWRISEDDSSWKYFWRLKVKAHCKNKTLRQCDIKDWQKTLRSSHIKIWVINLRVSKRNLNIYANLGNKITLCSVCHTPACNSHPIHNGKFIKSFKAN